MKIAILPRSGLFCEGGTGTYLQNIVPHLPSLGYKVTIYTTLSKKHEKNFFSNVEYITVKGNHTSVKDRVDLATRQANDVVKRDFDIVNIHYPAAALMADKIKNSGKKVVVTHHGSQVIAKSALEPLGKYYYYLYKKALKNVDAVVIHNKKIAEIYKKEGIKSIYFQNQGTVIKNKVKGKSFLLKIGLEPKRYILFLGKIRKSKGVDFLIAAYNKSKVKMPLVIAGGCEYEPEFYKKIKKSAPPGAKFVGEILGKEKDIFISNSYFLVNPIRSGALSLSALEAMGMGVCVLNGKDANYHKIIREHTFLFKNEDEGSLACAIKHLISNKSLVEKIGKDAQKFAKKNHKWEDIINLYDKIFQRLDIN